MYRLWHDTGLGTPTSNSPVISTSPPELLGRPEVVGKADTQYNDNLGKFELCSFYNRQVPVNHDY